MKKSKMYTLNIRLTDRTKRRLMLLAEDKDVSMNEIVNIALSNYLDDQDMNHSAPDLVLDRMKQLLVSQMNIKQVLEKVANNQRNLEEILLDRDKY